MTGTVSYKYIVLIVYFYLNDPAGRKTTTSKYYEVYLSYTMYKYYVLYL
jgi:hypothetical protein